MPTKKDLYFEELINKTWNLVQSNVSISPIRMKEIEKTFFSKV
jgi:hypothetical protein